MRNRTIEILLVEDNPGDVFLIREAFLEAHVSGTLSVAGDGIEALAFVRRQGRYQSVPPPDLILLDLNLPRVSGTEVLRQIKADPDLRRIPVMVLTSSDSDHEVREVYDLHANCYITKPVDLEGFGRVARAIEEFWVGLVTLPHRT